jgi:hypothetical protein
MTRSRSTLADAGGALGRRLLTTSAAAVNTPAAFILKGEAVTSPEPNFSGANDEARSRLEADSSQASARRSITREEWLLRIIDGLRPLYRDTGSPIPDRLRVSCGWPSGAAFAPVHRCIGECWSRSASADRAIEIFISPNLGEALDVAETLVHELVHAAGAKGHRGTFPARAKAVGLIKPWRSTTASVQLKARLNALIEVIGSYPHATLDTAMRPHKNDRARLLKVACPECGYTVRTTRMWLQVGFPYCACGVRMAKAEAIRHPLRKLDASRNEGRGGK